MAAGLDCTGAPVHQQLMDLFGAAAPESADGAYRVLARKYRPADFAGLIGQDALVQTLANAFASGRLAQAWLLTGVRGVGKTSTARIIAKALNCTGPDGTGGPTIAPCGQCETCIGIAAGNHMDVIEMDAASNTGVDDVREIIEAVRYGPTSARTKIYIIDEVHMLSRNAFNALLKTLEEPPAHVKFIFATTEVEKLPPTILSRCQRFDLRRVPHALLVEHFSRVVAAERVEAEPQALELVALAADGSVRDGLSILDQAIARCDGQVTADAVRDMLGLADRGAVAAILDAVLAADAPAALAAFATAHDAGADPAALMEGLLALVHATMRTILAGAPDPALGEGEQAAVARWAADLDVTLVHRLWQLALKGLEDIRAAPRADHAAEMALLRMAHGSGLPDPGALLHPHADAPGAAASRGGTSALAKAGARAAEVPADLAGLAALLASAHEAELARALTDCVGLIEFRPGALRLQARGMLPDRFGAELGSALGRLTGLDWKVELNRDGPVAETLREAEARVAADRTAAVRADARVQALLDTFPGSEVITVAAPAASDAVETRSAKK